MGYYRTNELYHHGILGQKWGVRRYQNPDGSLTAEGKRRYFKNGTDRSGGLTKEGQKAQEEFDSHFYKDWYKSYNRAAERINPELNKLNKKHKNANLDDINSADTQKYIRECHEVWTKIYSEELLKDFGESVEDGYGYILGAPFMDTFISMIND